MCNCMDYFIVRQNYETESLTIKLEHVHVLIPVM